MTAQELFTTVVNHLLTQNAKAETEDQELCLYFDVETGRKCAAGILIPPDKYQPRWDISGEDVRVVAKEIGLFVHVDLIRALQDIHDGDEPEEWYDKFAAIAANWGLEMPA